MKRFQGRFSIGLRFCLTIMFATLCSGILFLKNRSADFAPPIYLQTTKEREFYEAALKATPEHVKINPGEVWGVVVPHHLLAANLLAEALFQLRSKQVETIFLLSPDHFERGKTRLTLTGADLITPVGRSTVDPNAFQEIARMPGVGMQNDIFAYEHGVGSILPFLQILWPKAKIVPILFRGDAEPQDLAEIVVYLQKQIVEPDTLIVESSDFSHYLPAEAAAKKDQETINALLSSEPEAILGLKQPGNSDSLIVLYLNKLLQEKTESSLEIFRNQNSQSYSAEKVAETTSYLTLFFSKKPLEIARSGNELLFGGDFFSGRFQLEKMRETRFRQQEAERLTAVTKNQPLIVNFEGYLAENCDPAEELLLCMETEPTLDFLQKLNVIGVSLANNHSRDGGAEAYTKTKIILKDHNIAVFEHGVPAAFSFAGRELALLALTDIDPESKARGFLYMDDLKTILQNFTTSFPTAKKIAFLHWGLEYSGALEEREQYISDQIVKADIPLMFGAHTHIGSALQCFHDHILQFSLGNFFFDQPENACKGKLIRIKFLETGTMVVKDERLC